MKWERYEGLHLRKWPHRICAHMRGDPFDLGNAILRFCFDNFGRDGIDERWSFTNHPTELDNGRYVTYRVIVGFESETDMVYFRTGFEYE